MLIGILSDTHDHRIHTLEAINRLAEAKVDVVLHAGDLISPFVIKAFGERFGEKFKAVFGNNDGEKLGLRSMIENYGGSIEDYCFKGEFADRTFYMTHTQHNIEEIAASQMYDVVIYGHTHQQDLRQVNKTLVINPGEVTDWITGQSHFIVLDTSDLSYEILKIN